GGEPEPTRTLDDVPFNMQWGYLDHVRSMGVTGVSDEQLLAAGLYVCEHYGPYTVDADPADRQAAQTAILTGDLIPAEASGPAGFAVLSGTSFLCLEGP